MDLIKYSRSFCDGFVCIKLKKYSKDLIIWEAVKKSSPYLKVLSEGIFSRYSMLFRRLCSSPSYNISSLNPGWDDGESLISGYGFLMVHPAKKMESRAMIKMTEIVLRKDE